MKALHPTVAAVTDRIASRSAKSRSDYLAAIVEQPRRPRRGLSCGNLAHGFAASGIDKERIKGGGAPNIGIITSYNDVLSAHTPYRWFPDIIKQAARENGATAQVAAGVPAMCDGVTQGQPGMELSLFSRDTIAMATAVGLSHAMFDGVLLLGICDKIVPGLLMGALRFGNLPTILIPGGPMPTGLSHKEKVAVRQRYAQGTATDAELLEAESLTYHTEGTCSFYGTANSNQMMMEAMGLHVPAAAFIPPGSELRKALTRVAVDRIVALAQDADGERALGRCVDEKAIVNAMVVLLASGGSTNHTIHLPAIARSAGILIDWDDFDALSGVVPLLARIYPNGTVDINGFQAAGGPGFLIGELLRGGLLHPDITTVWGKFTDYATEPSLKEGALHWHAVVESRGAEVARPIEKSFQPDGGLKLLHGNLGRAVIKTSAVEETYWTVEAEAMVFDDQDDALRALSAGALARDCIVVVRFQGPRANGMPELHKLTPILGALQDQGHRVALLTDGRMSGASGKVPAAIHLIPEAIAGGPLAYVENGDRIRICARTGTIQLLVADDVLAARPEAIPAAAPWGCGRELFDAFRHICPNAEEGASPLLSGFITDRERRSSAADARE
ncbi:phosphogluconate dehydratase [Sphingomonas zeicaulis]|uniref:phosphogluconate dehydratase n=1 Tax=Sphingomonas zeicaulis TaxID=1632740 RepID=UPI003D25237D